MSKDKIKGKKYNELLPLKPKKKYLSAPQKALYCIFFATVGIFSVPDIVQLVNRLKAGDQTEIKYPQKEDLFPVEDDNNLAISPPVEDKVENKFTLDFLKDYLKSEISGKTNFKLEDEFDILGAWEINALSDAFDEKDTTINLLIKQKNGKHAWVVFNNNNSQIEIENEGLSNNIISSLAAHLQTSSIVDVYNNLEGAEDLMYNFPEKNVVFVGPVGDYVEKNNELSYSLPVVTLVNGKYELTLYKNLQIELDKLEVSPLDAFAAMLIGEIPEILSTYSNSKQNNFDGLNKVLLEQLEDNQDKGEVVNPDLFPDDEFATSQTSTPKSARRGYDYTKHEKKSEKTTVARKTIIDYNINLL